MRWLVGCLCITPLKNATGAFWLHPLRQTFGLLAFGFAYGELISNFGLIMLPAEADDMEPANNAIMMTFLLFISGVSQFSGPLAGYYSDRCQLNWGRRRPYLFVGTLFTIPSVIMLWVSHNMYYVEGEGDGQTGSFAAVNTTDHSSLFGFKVGFYDPYVPDGVERSVGVARFESLDDLVSSSDCVSLHCVHTEETSNILNREILTSKIKPGCIVINTARQGLIDDHALGDAIRSGRVDSAGLDCLASEPKLTHSYDATGPFQGCRDKVTVTPHASFFSESSILDMKRMSALEVKKLFQNKDSNNIVNREWLDMELANERMLRASLS